MNLLRNPRRKRVIPVRSGVALILVIVLIGLFGALCQTLTVLAAIQHRQAFDAADRAQAGRIAEAGLLSASTRLRRDPEWVGDRWTPVLPGGGSATVDFKVNRTDPERIVVEVEARYQPQSGRRHQVQQTLVLVVAPAGDPQKSSQP